MEDFFYICTIANTMNNFLIFFNISGGEILLIVIVVYLVFGPKKIPEFARMIGKGINELRRATNDIKNEINREANKVKNDIGIDLDDPLDTNPKKKQTKTSSESSTTSDNKRTKTSSKSSKTTSKKQKTAPEKDSKESFK